MNPHLDGVGWQRLDDTSDPADGDRSDLRKGQGRYQVIRQQGSVGCCVHLARNVPQFSASNGVSEGDVNERGWRLELGQVVVTDHDMPPEGRTSRRTPEREIGSGA